MGASIRWYAWSGLRAHCSGHVGLFVAIVVLAALSGLACKQRRAILPIGNVETPSPGAHTGSQVRISGWGCSSVGSVFIDVYVDGRYRGSWNTGGHRPDVSRAYPDFRGCVDSGFDFLLDLSSERVGQHQLTVQARDSEDSVAELFDFPIVIEK